VSQKCKNDNGEEEMPSEETDDSTLAFDAEMGWSTLDSG
jgi:hypothetical protein